MSARIRLEGKRFGHWTVGEYLGANANRHPTYQCRCDCGTEREVVAQALREGLTNSWGCMKAEFVRDGRDSPRRNGWSPERRAWYQMIYRVRPGNKRMAPMYADRGITVCDRWRSFDNFLADMGRIPRAGLSLDRIDNDKGYEPSNCRWADCQVQSQNRRQLQRRGPR